MKALGAAGCALLGFTVAIAAGANDPSGRTLELPESALAPFASWLRFYASFDDDVQAEFAAGKPAPVREMGSSRHEAGVLGSGLRLGVAGNGAQIHYAAAGNLDLTRPGALSFWVSPASWRETALPTVSRYVRFVRIPGAGGSVFVVERDGRSPGVDVERLLVGFSGLSSGKAPLLSVPTGARWSAGQWHLIAVNWDATGFAVSVDGGAFIRQAIPSGWIYADFGTPPPNAEWIVGDGGREATVLDELVIYARSLSDEEAHHLHERRRDSRFWPGGVLRSRGGSPRPPFDGPSD